MEISQLLVLVREFQLAALVLLEEGSNPVISGVQLEGNYGQVKISISNNLEESLKSLKILFA